MSDREITVKRPGESSPKIEDIERNLSKDGPDRILIRKTLLRKFQKLGIRCFSQVETHSRSGGELIVRGIESGGAVKNVGHYVTFCDDVGESVPGYYSYVSGIGFNGRHAIVVASSLVKVEMGREGHMYRLLITRHFPDPSRIGSERPGSLVERIFYGPEGYLPSDLMEKKNKDKRGLVVPSFFTAAGEVMTIPGEWMAAVRAATSGANCPNCIHAHYVGIPQDGHST